MSTLAETGRGLAVMGLNFMCELRDAPKAFFLRVLGRCFFAVNQLSACLCMHVNDAVVPSDFL